MNRLAGLSAALDVSRETEERLETLVELVRKWTPHINLVSPGSLENLWTRHVMDSAQLFSLAPVTSGRWLDIGSGGGFPGLVIAAIASEHAPDARIALVESDRRKAAFLRTAIREMELDADLHVCRAETLAPQMADVVSARALADLDRLLEFAVRHLRPGGTGLFPKGVRWEEEVARARLSWHFDLESCRSETEPQAAILKVGDIARV